MKNKHMKAVEKIRHHIVSSVKAYDTEFEKVSEHKEAAEIVYEEFNAAFNHESEIYREASELSRFYKYLIYGVPFNFCVSPDERRDFIRTLKVFNMALYEDDHAADSFYTRLIYTEIMNLTRKE